MRNIKAVLWDVDGTLLDFLAAEREAIKTCFSLFGLGECTDEMIAQYSAINVRWWQALERGEYTKPEILVGRFAEFFTARGIDTAVAPAFNAEYQLRLGDTIKFCPHALETVQALRGIAAQCAVTNGTKIAQDKKLERSGLDTAARPDLHLRGRGRGKTVAGVLCPGVRGVSRHKAGGDADRRRLAHERYPRRRQRRNTDLLV